MEQPVEARLVGELTKMGFAAELSQRAVLHTNAAGLQAALDWLVASAADEPPPPALPQASEEDMLAAAIAASLEPADDPSARRGRASPDELSEAEILAAEAQFERLSAAGWSTDSVDGGDTAPASWPPLPDALLDDGAQELMLRRLERAPSATVIAKAALVFRRRAVAARKRAGSGETLGAVRSPPRRGGEAAGAGGEGGVGGAEGAAVSVTSHEQTILEGNLLLRQRLTQLGLQNVSVGDDGNCQFRAISQQCYGDEQYHYATRLAVCEHMRKERDFFGAMFDGDELMAYVERMECQRTWGDELTLRAAADCFGCTIHLVTSTESNWYLRYEPQTGTPRKNLFLTYVYPIHYDAVSPVVHSGAVARPKPKSPYSPAAKAPPPSKTPNQMAPRPRSLTPKRTSSPARGTQARPLSQPPTPGKPGGPAKI